MPNGGTLTVRLRRDGVWADVSVIDSTAPAYGGVAASRLFERVRQRQGDWSGTGVVVSRRTSRTTAARWPRRQNRPAPRAGRASGSLRGLPSE